MQLLYQNVEKCLFFQLNGKYLFIWENLSKENVMLGIIDCFTVKPPKAGIPNSRLAMNNENKTLSPRCDNFFKIHPNSRHLSITDKFFKTCRCPLFRDFTIYVCHWSFNTVRDQSSSVYHRNWQSLQ